MIELLTELLKIESPTYKEKTILTFIESWLKKEVPAAELTVSEDGILVRLGTDAEKNTIGLVGHVDVVPAHFEPYIENGKLHGSGASDMKGAVACFLNVLREIKDMTDLPYNIALVIYGREEGTAIENNGLYALLKNEPAFFEGLSLAIAGEPTDNTVQIGCVGSIHTRIRVKGQACHSARPWNGENAIYNALPVIQKLSNLKPIKHTIFGQDFFDVIQLTESKSEAGRTSLPGYWEGNVNFRYAPVYSDEEAIAQFKEILLECGVPEANQTLIDAAPAGHVLTTALFQKVVEDLDCPIQAKQAWTDVAQLTRANIPAFNFGPGLTAQAHQDNEYIMVDDVKKYYGLIYNFLTGKSKA